jgi:Ca2+-binding EF-hand superfamily protein
VCEQLIAPEDADGRAAVHEGYEHMWQHLASAADTNSDGRISFEEYQAAVEQNLLGNPEVFQNSVVRITTAAFVGVDEDKDGMLNESELVKLGAAVGVPRDNAVTVFAKLDEHNTGTITLDQFLSAVRDLWLGSAPDGLGELIVGHSS